MSYPWKYPSGEILKSGAYTALLVLFLSLSANCNEPSPTQGPILREAVPPKSVDAPAQTRTPAPQWKPGDPVRVRPDLKSSSQPRVSDSVTPKVQDENLKNAPIISPPPPDAPVRVRPDLRQTPPPGGEPK